MAVQAGGAAGVSGNNGSFRARPRPATLRALGHAEPPRVVRLDGETFEHVETLKHDSWAATALYRSPTRAAKCKFNRTQPIGPVPMRWLGRSLAARERWFIERLAGIEGVPVSLGEVFATDGRLGHAVAHAWIDGHALAERELVADSFFPRLEAILAETHRRGVAHVDLNKRENILVDDAGRPHLIDYQIAFALPTNRLVAAVLRGVLRMLQRCDDYHLLKHRVRHRPDQAGGTAEDLRRMRPWWIRAHRCVAVPFRTVRRRILTVLGVRAAGGRVSSEAFPEVAHRVAG